MNSLQEHIRMTQIPVKFLEFLDCPGNPFECGLHIVPHHLSYCHRHEIHEDMYCLFVWSDSFGNREWVERLPNGLEFTKLIMGDDGVKRWVKFNIVSPSQQHNKWGCFDGFYHNQFTFEFLEGDHRVYVKLNGEVFYPHDCNSLPPQMIHPQMKIHTWINDKNQAIVWTWNPYQKYCVDKADDVLGPVFIR